MKVRFPALLFTGLALLGSCKKNDPEKPQPDVVAIRGELKGQYIAPLPVTGTAGTGDFTGSFDKNTNELTYTLTFAGLSSQLTLPHFHLGAPGVKVPSFFTMPGLTSPLTGKAVLTPAQREALLSGNVYANLHTVNHQEFGEIRAQLTTPNLLLVSGQLSGAQQVPAVSTSATGVASGIFNKETNELSYTVSYAGLTPVAGHFHIAPPGQANPASSLPLASLANPVVATATLTSAQREALLAGNLYVNLHSQAFPDGEIRANLVAR